MDSLLLNSCITSPVGYSECGYTKPTRDTCTSTTERGRTKKFLVRGAVLIQFLLFLRRGTDDTYRSVIVTMSFSGGGGTALPDPDRYGPTEETSE